MGRDFQFKRDHVPDEVCHAVTALLSTWHQTLLKLAEVERQLAERDEQYRELLKRLEQRPV